jgi:hypothetical protein
MRAALIAFALTAAPLAAQTTTIAPGMTRDQVETLFGRPAAERHFGAHDYLLFDADCGRKCGDDLVILDQNKVVDAIIRSSGRAYSGGGEPATTLTGTTSSRPAVPPLLPPTAADSQHRSGMVFEGPRPPATPPRYQVFTPPKHDSTSSTPPPAAPHR